MTMHINFWYFVTPAMSLFVFWLALHMTTVDNRNDEPAVRQRLSKRGLETLGGFLAFVTSLAFAAMLVLESFRGIVELCGRDNEDSVFAAFFFVLLAFFFYYGVQYVMWYMGIEVGLRINIGLVARDYKFSAPLSWQEKLKRRVARFCRNAAPLYITTRTIHPEEVMREYKRQQEIYGEHAKVIELYGVVHETRVCTREPFSNVRFLPKSLRRKLGSCCFDSYKSYLRHQERTNKKSA